MIGKNQIRRRHLLAGGFFDIIDMEKYMRLLYEYLLD